MTKPVGPGSIQGKFWGNTRPLFEYNDMECHYINGEKDGYCSEHYHDYKWNRFFVISGKIKVTIFNEDGNGNRVGEDVTILEAGQTTDVPPKVWHMFEVTEDCMALEFYWVDLDPGDIVRRTTGGNRGVIDGNNPE